MGRTTHQRHHRTDARALDRGAQCAIGFGVLAALLNDEIGIGLDLLQQLANARDVHAHQAQRSAFATQKTREGCGNARTGLLVGFKPVTQLVTQVQRAAPGTEPFSTDTLCSTSQRRLSVLSPQLL